MFSHLSESYYVFLRFVTLFHHVGLNHSSKEAMGEFINWRIRE